MKGEGGLHSFGLMDDGPWSSIATMNIKKKRRNRRREYRERATRRGA